MTFKVSRKKQFAIKLESTNGTKATIGTSDYGLQLNTMSIAPNVEMFDNNVFKGSIDQSESRTGKCSASCSIGGELKNSGTLNTSPKIDPVLKASRMVQSVVYGYAFTSASGSSTRLADIITGGTSGATGRFVKIEGSKIYLADISGTFTVGETLTDSLGNWTATAGAKDGTATGFLYRVSSISASEVCATIFGNEDGIGKSIYGSAGNFALDLGTDGYAKFTATLNGIMDKSAFGTAVAMLDDASITWESNSPAVVNSASLTIGNYSPVGVGRVTVDIGAQNTLIDDLNSTTWLDYASVNGRNAGGTIEVLAIDPSAYNAYAAFIAGTKASLNFTIGTGAGTQIEVMLPYIQYTGITDGDKNGFLQNSITFKAVGDDMSVGIWFR